MKSLSASVLILVLGLGMLLLGCDVTRHPTEPANGDQNPAYHHSKGNGGTSQSVVVPLPQTVSLLGFTVAYQGSQTANNQTTFLYKVTGPGVKSHFTLELPACAGSLVAYSPSGSANFNTDPNVGIQGIEWQLSLGAGDTSAHYYSITFQGAVHEGIILTAVKSNDQAQTGFIAGPCARVYAISGTVFTDANTDGLYNPGEAGISGVTVYLLNAANTVLGSSVTNGYGQYLFELLPAGAYAVRVDTNTLTSASKSAKYLSPTTAASYSVTLGPDSPNNNFGYTPQTTSLTNDIKFGVIPTNGRSAGFWKRQFQIALSGGTNADIDAATLRAYLDQVVLLQLPDPFTFPNGFQTAFDILDNPAKTDLDQLKKQLLATELNHVSGRGILGTDPGLQLLLIGWGEALVLSGKTASASISNAKGIVAPTITSTASSATGLFSTINSGGGGGNL